MKSRRITILLSALMVAFNLAGCANDNKTNIDDNMTPLSDSYDKESVAILIGKDADNKILTLLDMTDGEEYDQYYNGATYFINQNGDSISNAQLKTGSVVKYIANAKTDMIKSMTEEENTTYLGELNDYAFNNDRTKINIYGIDYDINSKAVVVSNNAKIDINMIEMVDILSAWVYKNQIVSINVDRGHGFLSLENEEAVLNGWIEVGDSIITKIHDDMKLVVPEGEVNVVISKKKTKINQKIYFERFESMIWDLSSVEVANDTASSSQKEDDIEESSSEEETDEEEYKLENYGVSLDNYEEEIEKNSESDTSDINKSDLE